MNLLKKTIFLLFIGVFVLTSCKKEKENLQLSAIPADVFYVFAFENQKMIKKGGLDNLSEYELFQKLQEEMDDNLEPGAKKIFEEFLKNPKSAGLDIEKMYIYGNMEGYGMYNIMNFKLDSRSTFEKKMKDFAESQDEDLPEITEEGGVKMILADRNFVIAWSEDLLLMFSGQIGSLDYKSYFDLPADQSILSVDDFATFQKDSYDIGMWISYGTLLSSVGEMMTATMPAYASELKDAYVHGYVNFNDGEIKAIGRVSPQSKYEDLMKKFPIMKGNIDPALLGDFPDKSFFLASISVNWAEYVKLLVDQFNQIGMYEDMLNDPAVQTIIDIVGGDLLFSIYNFAQDQLPIPLAGLSFTLQKDGDFERLLGLFPEGALTKNGDYYEIPTPAGVSINVGYKDKRVFITDDTEAIKSFFGGGFSPNLKDGVVANELKTSPSVIYMNLDLETYPDNIRGLITGFATGMAKAALKFIEPMKDVSCYNNEKGEVIFSLKFKDSKRNSLKTLLKSIDELASQM